MGTFFWGPHNKDYSIFEGLYWGPPILGNYHMSDMPRVDILELISVQGVHAYTMHAVDVA